MEGKVEFHSSVSVRRQGRSARMALQGGWERDGKILHEAMAENSGKATDGKCHSSITQVGDRSNAQVSRIIDQ